MKRFTYFNTKPVNPMTIGLDTDKAELARRNSCERSEIFSWVDLNRECMLGRTPDTLICGVSQIFENNPNDFLSTIYSIINTHSNNKKITLCVPGGDELQYEHIPKLQSIGFKGALPISAYYGVDESARGINHFLHNQEYWPKFVINNCKDKQRVPTVIVFNDKVEEQLNLSVYRFFFKQKEENKFKVEIASSWNDLSSQLRKNPAAVIFHADMIEDSAQEFVSTLESMIKFSHPKRKIVIGASISKHTTLDLVKELQQTKITGIVPGFNSWGGEECLNSVLHLIDSIPYWPKHILKQLPGLSNKVKRHDVDLSYRQQQILNLIQTRGITNQQIADKLKIKEGTVKLHVGVLLKKYSVRNRTQLANL
jgi:DNA-binding NarL/FixJ family response regulator